MKLSSVVLFVAYCAAEALAYKSYDGYQIIRTKELQNNEEVRTVLPLTKNNDYNFFTSPRAGSGVDILVGPGQTVELQSTLRTLGLHPEVLVENVESVLNEERRQIDASSLVRDLSPSDRFLNFDEIMEYLELVATKHPEIATIVDIGKSWEGRPIRVLKLSSGPGKKAIFLDSAIHAREWIGPPTILHAINELTSNLLENQVLLDAHDWYFLPVANPDGYVYSWTEDRFWRKTRSPNNGSECVGTDPNRNFDYKWEDGINNTCSDSYHGSKPYSEPETEAIARFILENNDITFYLTVHSYGQLILLPWEIEKQQNETDFSEVQAVAADAKEAIAAVNGTQYKFGITHQLLSYYAHGTSYDWAYAKAGVRLSYTIELSPEFMNFVTSNFIVDTKKIPLINAESWAAYKAFASHLPETRRAVSEEDASLIESSTTMVGLEV